MMLRRVHAAWLAAAPAAAQNRPCHTDVVDTFGAVFRAAFNGRCSHSGLCRSAATAMVMGDGLHYFVSWVTLFCVVSYPFGRSPES